MPKRLRVDAGSATKQRDIDSLTSNLVEKRVHTSEAEIADVYVDDDEASDGDVDEEELEALHRLIDARGIVRTAALGRVSAHTREAYDLHMRQCAVWAKSNAQFKMKS